MRARCAARLWELVRPAWRAGGCPRARAAFAVLLGGTLLAPPLLPRPARASPLADRAPALPPVPAAVYAERRARLAARLAEPARPLIVPSGRRPAGEHDIDFRVESDFFYLTGLELPEARLVLWREQGRAAAALLLPRRRPGGERWEGPALHARSPALRALGFAQILEEGSAAADELLARLGPPLALAPHRRELAALRLRKDPHEIARIEAACAITARALDEAMRTVEPELTEREVDAVIRYVFARLGAARAAFTGIVASGPNGCVLHHRPGTRRLRAGELVVMDVGAEYERYAADITRTVPVSGRFSERQRALYLAVLRAQDAALARVRPGATLSEIDGAARAALAAEGLAQYFHHGTCHWVGLDVHDAGEAHTPLEPGMVLTVEPGIYLDAEGIGIRIEDVVLVTEDGARLLSAGALRHPGAIEARMRERGLGNAPLPPPATAPGRKRL
ncbi:MAG: Xaa-Pro aminopeptidase [Planctomycetota bacterium]|nr:MAG: Xaa-Pro aminopeptidase [Planctomycetota bacterium]